MPKFIVTILLAAAAVAVNPLPLAASAQDSPGWLGVQLTEVPAPLASHFGLGDAGVMVENVVVDSPADEGGLEQWDIITAIDGEPAPPAVTALADIIRNKGPDATLELTVLHDGQERPVSVTLATRPDRIASTQWKSPWSPRDILRERVHGRSGVLTRDSDGNWVLKNLADLEDLPPELHKLIPGPLDMTARVFSDDRQVISIIVHRDGQNIEITQDNGGEIRVRRTSKEGDDETVSEKTYADLQALRQGDQEAYDMFTDCEPRACVKTETSLLLPHRLKLKTKDLHIDIADDLKRWREEFTKNLDEWTKGAEDLPDLSILRSLDLPHALELSPSQPSGIPGLFLRPGDAASPRYTFRVNDDGTIEVTTRRGDAEIIDVYGDEADLKSRNTALHERFEALRSPPED